MNIKIANTYKLTRRIGQGAFGEIYLALNFKTNLEYAVKLEPITAQYPQVYYEAKIYNYFGGEVGIPKVYFSGSEGEYNVMVMDLLGLSLEDLMNRNNRKFSLKTTLMLFEQMIARIEFVHSKHFLHRDIKPDNFLMGKGKNVHILYIVDFGLSKKFITKEGKHIPYREHKSLTGTARYASINTHIGIEQARRDDMESIGYVMIYLIKGVLPWQNLKCNAKQDKYQKIMEKKMATPTESLCKGLPLEFTTYINYCKGLKFEEKPDYSYLRNLFLTLMKKEGLENDYIFDWTKEDVKNNGISNTINNNNNDEKLIKEKEKEAKMEAKVLKEENNNKPELKTKNDPKLKNAIDKQPLEVKQIKLNELARLNTNEDKVEKNKQTKKDEDNLKENLKKQTFKKSSFVEQNKQAFKDTNKKDMLKTFLNSQQYSGPKIVINKATYK